MHLMTSPLQYNTSMSARPVDHWPIRKFLACMLKVRLYNHYTYTATCDGFGEAQYHTAATDKLRVFVDNIGTSSHAVCRGKQAFL